MSKYVMKSINICQKNIQNILYIQHIKIIYIAKDTNKVTKQGNKTFENIKHVDEKGAEY